MSITANGIKKQWTKLSPLLSDEKLAEVRQKFGFKDMPENAEQYEHFKEWCDEHDIKEKRGSNKRTIPKEKDVLTTLRGLKVEIPPIKSFMHTETKFLTDVKAELDRLLDEANTQIAEQKEQEKKELSEQIAELQRQLQALG